ncbi:hypothetical protein B0H16DRAFT_1525381 [Mycena metata]|uniref:Endoplasmic reticulum junction formation protein lunapark n=1 Tax=Mycena metata TaxID=1033252 RepID=A0AAD7JH48_9AGAR|nr:hypothetical protein B0H16DRAFT_1525381 [Mycena metata]
MSFLWRLFRATTTESVLAALANDIAKRQTLLSEIRRRERKATALVTLYTLAVLSASTLPSGRSANGIERAARALPRCFSGLSLFYLSAASCKYGIISTGNAEEKTLQALLKQQRAKVEEIKKKTNFYSTRDLLSRYDASASTPGSPASAPASARGGQPQPQTPQRGASVAQRGRPSVGSSLLSEKQKYALICEKCFAHNGLVPEGVWEGMQYTCPKCGHFNPSARSKRLGLVSPTTPSMSASQAGASSRSAFAEMQNATGGVGSAGAGLPLEIREQPSPLAGGEGVRKRSARKGRGLRDEGGDGDEEGVERMEVDPA